MARPRFIEHTPRIDSHDVKKKLTEEGRRRTATTVVAINEQQVELNVDCQGRVWFVCPRCGLRIKHLYLPEVACRHCLKLWYEADWKQYREHRVPLRIGDAIRWRKKIEVTTTPFSPLPTLEQFRRYSQLIRVRESLILRSQVV